MFRTILLELFLPFRPFKQTSDKLRFLHRSYMRAKQNGGLLLREKQARQLSTCLSKPLTAQRCGHRWPWNHGNIEPLNHWTKNLKSLQNVVCCRLMPGSKNQKKHFGAAPTYNNFQFVLCGILASREDVLFSLHYFSSCKHYLMKCNRFCNLQRVMLRPVSKLVSGKLKVHNISLPKFDLSFLNSN